MKDMIEQSDADNGGYNVSIFNIENNLTTTINGTSIQYAIEVLKKIQTPLKRNVTEGMSVRGKHKNSRSTDNKATKL